ncbi:galactosylceramide sulfotransferase-like [Amphiura filiformis]|uniref:galactosylceramide sulfotransferase-like n=1 Tax=Amphiura filiformis TaxID=82378 RepID=UPI003B20BFA4
MLTWSTSVPTAYSTILSVPEETYCVYFELIIMSERGKSAFVGVVFTVFLLYSIFAAFLPPDPSIIQHRWPQPRSPYRDANISTSIPNVSTTISSDVGTTPEPVHNCSASKTLVYIKSHKTGSTTLQTIVNRFGFYHNLSFVFNKKSSYNGHFYFIPVTVKSPQTYFLPPLGVRAGDYRKYKDYDMLAVHVRYNRTAMDKFMKKDVKYISIIREPSDQWESAFTQFLFEDAFPDAKSIPKEKWIEMFLEKPSFYREKLHYMKFENVMGRRWYYAQNSQMYDLGLDTGHSFYNETIINATIRSIDKEFVMILVLEYFDESLLILKKELCWDYEDIVYIPKNLRDSRRNLTDEVRQKIREFNYADVLLYDYFNKTLWRKIKEYGPKFEEDLQYFKNLNQHITNECGNANRNTFKKGKRIFKYKDSEFSPKKNATFFCRTVAENKRALFQRVYERQNPYKKRPRPPAKTLPKQEPSRVSAARNRIQETAIAAKARAVRLLQAHNAKINSGIAKTSGASTNMTNNNPTSQLTPKKNIDAPVAEHEDEHRPI